MNDIERLRRLRVKTARRAGRRAWANQFCWWFELDWPATLFGRVWAFCALLIPPGFMLLALWILGQWSPRRPNAAPPDDRGAA